MKRHQEVQGSSVAPGDNRNKGNKGPGTKADQDGFCPTREEKN